MSTIKSSSANLTLNADGSGNDIKFQSNAVEKGSLTDGGVFIGSTFEPTGDTAASDNAAIGYTSAEGLILTGQGSTDDVTIKNDADTTVLNVATGSSDIEVSAGDLIFGTAGKGVCLGVTSNTDANTLDDYEEGTWTPALEGTGGGTGSLNASYDHGSYTKVGRLVTFNCYCIATSVGDMSNAVRISGLPFTVKSGEYNAVSFAGVEGLAITAGVSITGYTNSNTDDFYLQQFSATTGIAAYGLYIAEFSADGGFLASGSYFT